MALDRDGAAGAGQHGACRSCAALLLCQMLYRISLSDEAASCDAWFYQLRE